MVTRVMARVFSIWTGVRHGFGSELMLGLNYEVKVTDFQLGGYVSSVFILLGGYV